jgi:hypothetical protein
MTKKSFIIKPLIESPKSTSKHFEKASVGQKLDYKCNLGERSTSEPKSKILSLKFNPVEKAEAGNGLAEINSKNIKRFGRYSARFKEPMLKKFSLMCELCGRLFHIAYGQSPKFKRDRFCMITRRPEHCLHRNVDG